MAIAAHYRLRPSLAKSTLAVAFGLIFSACPVSTWAAGTIVDSVGFESPTFNNGNLKPQNGWNQSSLPLVVNAIPSTATVETGTAATGSRGVRVDRSANSNDWWAVPKSGFPTQRFVTVDWDMAVNQTFTTGVGPFFGINAFDYLQNGAGDPPPGVGVLGSLGVDAATREVLYQAADTGYFTAATYADNSPAVVTYGAWNHFRIVFDFTLHQYSMFLGGVELIGAPVGFVDQSAVGGLQDFTDADIAALAANNDGPSFAATGTAYFDNYIVRDGLLGDYDQNGTVDAADYTVWKQAFGNTVATAGLGADGNGNGKVDAADFVVWRSHLGQSLFTGSGSGALSNGAVPEPPSATLIICGLVPAILIAARKIVSGFMVLV